jgi:hypothetical protein
MKQTFFLSALLFLTIIAFSQKKAITDTGEEVILYNDGTWKYANDSVDKEAEIATNPKPFKKSVSSSFLVKSTNFNVGVWVDPKKWSFTKSVDNEAAEYEFTLKGKDLYGMMITEGLEIPLETLKSIALDNAKDAAPDSKIIKQEYRNVNGKKVLCLHINGTTEGIKFSYYGYYFSNEKGTLQFVTYTAQNLFEKYLPDMEELLNGLVEVN